MAVAKIIVELAKVGERDPIRLRDLALKAVSGPSGTALAFLLLPCGYGRLGAVKDRAVAGRAGGHVSNSTLIAGNVMKTPVLVPASLPTVSPTKLSFLTGLNGSKKLLVGSK